MKRWINISMGSIVLPFILLSSLVALGGAQNQNPSTPAINVYSDQTQHFNIHKFYKMEDPKQAAVLLLEDAQKHGIDIDAIPLREFEPGPIRAPFAKIVPKEGDRSFIEMVSRSENKTEIPEEMVCIIQFSRSYSVKEIAGVLSLGVRLLSPVFTCGRIAKIPTNQLETVQDLPFVRWLGPYLPSYKYDQNRIYDYSWYFSVTAFIEDDVVIRKDLSAIDVEITTRRGRYTTIMLREEQLSTLANIWWVEKIYQSPRRQDGKELEFGAEYGAIQQGNPQDDFNAYDSRKLISM